VGNVVQLFKGPVARLYRRTCSALSAGRGTVVNTEEWVEVNGEWLERTVTFFTGLVFAGVGLVLVLWHADWDFSWMLLAAGVGVTASRWVPRKYLLGLAIGLAGLSLYSAGAVRWPLHMSSLGLFVAWLGTRLRGGISHLWRHSG